MQRASHRACFSCPRCQPHSTLSVPCPWPSRSCRLLLQSHPWDQLQDPHSEAMQYHSLGAWLVHLARRHPFVFPWWLVTELLAHTCRTVLTLLGEMSTQVLRPFLELGFICLFMVWAAESSELLHILELTSYHIHGLQSSGPMSQRPAHPVGCYP